MYTPSLPSLPSLPSVSAAPRAYRTRRPAPAAASAASARIKSGAAVTPMAFVRAIVQAYALRQKDASAALALAQIAPDSVTATRHSTYPDPPQCITAWQMEVLCDAAMRELDDEALGWFERRLPWGSYGMLARASITAPDLGLALSRWCRHHNLLTQAITLTLERHRSGKLGKFDDADQARIVLEIAPKEAGPLSPLAHPAHAGLRELCMVSVLRNLHGVACWLIDAPIVLLRAQFALAAPPHAAVYSLLFATQVQFDAPQTALVFDAHYLTRALARDEAQLCQMLQRALPLTVRPYRRERLLAQRVRQLLASDPAALHSAPEVAARLHLSARTLHRQLKDEGTSLQRLKDSARQAHASDLLQRTQRPMKQVAQAVGFASEKSFIRAFRLWTGQTPAQFRLGSRASAK